MSFVHYRIVLKLLSPLHIGKRKYRNLMETREYVPGRTLWGALTARITRDHFDGEANRYGEVGDFLIENFRFGYLWPSLDGKKPYFPWEHDDFDYLLKFGYMGQPIDYDKKATEEGQLHEAEFIGPKTRDGQQVYLIGDLWIKSSALTDVEKVEVGLDSKIIPLKGVFDSLQLGGERNYGWGRVAVEEFPKVPDSVALGGIEVENGDKVVLKFPKGAHVTAHVLAAEWEGMKPVDIKLHGKLHGPIEPLTGYEMKEPGKWGISTPPICYEPGTFYPAVENPATTAHPPIKLAIGKFGILVSLNGSGGEKDKR